MLSLRQISKVYADGTVALDQVSLDVGRGMIGLLGPNGAGKTTLLSILVLAQEPSGGQRTFFGLDDRNRHRPAIRQMVGYLPQDFVPVSDLTGFEYLRLCADLRQVPLRGRLLRQRLGRLLESVELTHAAHRRADRYSGGMARRLGLAQALVHSPRFLVVDEPTAGLDPEERIRFRNLINDLAEEIPVLLSTHIVEDIEATCPRLAILADGRLLFDGPPSRLMQRFENRLWRQPEQYGPAPDLQRVGRRVAADGSAFQVVHAEQMPPLGEAVEPTLEEACTAFLAIEAQQSLEDAEPC